MLVCVLVPELEGLTVTDLEGVLEGVLDGERVLEGVAVTVDDIVTVLEGVIVWD